MAVLALEGVSIFYDGLQAIWDISFSVEGDSITALVGSNGAGKTTILQGISGIIPRVKGKILHKGMAINHLPPHRRVDLGISLIPEGRRIFPDLSVQENLEIGAYSRGARKNLSETFCTVLELFPRLAERRKQMAASLSGGEQQMLAIGRGLMSRPHMLMLDEPSLGLAPLLVKLVFEIIRDINQHGVTILLVEQNVHRTLHIAQTAFVLETGKITLSGTGTELLKNPHIKKAYLGVIV
ncbi:MAG: ATP-binding cassette domain-containing protein [Proteobacteria bacterium]|nr:ATP-binding cassette domain-containing protein [Pseudomonadota bacterium]